MGSRKATLGLLIKISVEKLLWGMSTTRKGQEEAEERSSLRPSWQIQSSLGQPHLLSPATEDREQHQLHMKDITLASRFLKKDTQACPSRRLTLIPKVDMGEVKEKFIMLKGKNTACIWLEASTVLSITLVRVREQMTLMESQTGNGSVFFWTVCLWLWTDLKIHVKPKTSEQTN